MGNLITQPVLWNEIVDARDEALRIFDEEIHWTLGFNVSIAYHAGDKVYMISAVGIGDGYGLYTLNYDSQILESQLQTLYTTKVNVNGEQYHVLNSHEDEEISDPFNVQELLPTKGNNQ